MSQAPDTDDQQRQQIGVAFKHLHTDVLYTEKAHFAAAERLERIHVWLGTTATLLSTASAAAVVTSGSRPLAGALALGAALTTGVLTLRKPDRRSAVHLSTGRQYAALKLRLRHIIDLDVPHLPPSNLRTTLNELTKVKIGIDDGAPPSGHRDYNVGSIKIKAGTFDAD